MDNQSHKIHKIFEGGKIYMMLEKLTIPVRLSG
jgi:hypothetical protein